MTALYFLLTFLGTYICMEGVTWLTHKYVMHGFLWYLHKDHHQVEPGFFEKNDAFFIIFAIPSFLLILFGFSDHVWWMQAIGFGIMAYGFSYFMVHDVIIHQRFKWFTRSNSTYVRAIRWGHKMHHKHLGKKMGSASACSTCIASIGKRSGATRNSWPDPRKLNMPPKRIDPL